MHIPQSRMGWSGALVNLIPSVTGNAMFTARTGEWVRVCDCYVFMCVLGD